MATKPQIIPLILTLIGIAILCSLGTWQIQRLSWKENIISQIEAEYKKTQTDLVIDPRTLEESFGYKRALFPGKWLFDKQIAISPRTYNGKVGRVIITPLEIIGGNILLVNRGWVPMDWPLNEDKQAEQTAAFVTGLVKQLPKPNSFTPDNNIEMNQWYHLNLDDIKNAKSFDLPVYPYVMMLESTLPDQNTNEWALPIAQANKPQLKNDHLQYAIFWFTMAGVLFVIYVLRFHRKKPEEPEA